MSKKKKKSPLPASAHMANISQPEATTSSFSFLKKNRQFILLLFFYAFIVYINTINHEYAFDDSAVITENKFTKQGLKGIPDLITKDLFSGIYGQSLDIGGGRWRPLTLVSYAVEYQLFGLNPQISHGINILLYAITAIILLFTLQQLMPDKPLVAFIASLLFVAHPLHTEVVANIKSRDEILCFMGLMLTLFYLFKHISNENKKYLFYSGVAYFFSLLSKENGITFIVIIPLTLYCFANKTWKDSFIKTIPFFLIATVYFIIRTTLVGMIGDKESSDIMENPFVNAALVDKLATIFCILGKYLGLLFFPHPLSSDYSYNQIPIIDFTNIKAVVPFVIYFLFAVYAIKNINKRNIIAYGILFYLITLSIVSNMVFNIGAPMGERFLFLPSLGFCIVISGLFFSIFKIKNEKKIVIPSTLFIPLSIVMVGFTYKTIVRNRDWKNNLTLFSRDVETVPNDAKVHYYYANTLLNSVLNDKENPKRNSILQKAEKEFKTAVIINPKFHVCWYNLGLIYQELNQADSALRALNKVLELQPTHILTQGLIGSVYGKMKGDYDKAIFYLQKAVSYNPNDAGSFQNMAIAYAMKKEYDNAIKNFKIALQLRPDDYQIMRNIAGTYQNKGDIANAKIYFDKALMMEKGQLK